MKKDKISIRSKLLVYILSFVGALLLLLWLFQVVFLDQFYVSIKKDSLKTVAGNIAMNINNDELPAYMSTLARQNDMCIRVINSFDTQVGNFSGCAINDYNLNELKILYAKAIQNGGSYLETRFENNVFLIAPGISSSQKSKSLSKEMIYVKLEPRYEQDDTPAMILVNAHISPVNATTETLRVQLLYIGGIVVLASCLLVFFMSRKIAKPIVMINKAAKELAEGGYDANFEGEGYREISELNETLQTASLRLQEVERYRRELLANVSHDLRTPLTMISGYGEMMRDLPNENTPQNVQVIIDESQRLTRLVNDLLDLSKLQSQQNQLHIERVNLTSLIREVLYRFQQFVQQDGYTFIFEPEAEYYVQADKAKVEQVLYNLINNAVNYTGQDKKVWVNQILDGTKIRIEVVDSGEGIEKEKIPYIWERYYKIDKTHKRGVGGSGIGLSIVKNILELHHGEYGVVCEPDKGSRFYFVLKREEDKSA